MRLRLAFTATAAAVAVAATACSAGVPDATPPTATVTVTAPTSSASATAAPATPTTSATAPVPAEAGGCMTNPANAPVPAVERYEAVPESDQVSVAITAPAWGTVRPGAAPVEIDVTVCNDSPVAYPLVGLTVSLEMCSCSPGPVPIARGSVETFDPSTGEWVASDYPAAGTGADYLGAFMNVQELPKGKALSVRYRIALDATMTDGEGGVAATVVTADGTLNQLGTARAPFKVSTSG